MLNFFLVYLLVLLAGRLHIYFKFKVVTLSSFSIGLVISKVVLISGEVVIDLLK